MTDTLWIATVSLPGLPELGAYTTRLACAEAAGYFSALLDVAVRCYREVGA